ncbi:hypothetical protein [Rhodopirellula bahusiensis]|uniref:hypothetical protein n=1 Tax=Rhodopirellula bahusiensis TaxID=2014065 RepID=UPI0032678B34
MDDHRVSRGSEVRDDDSFPHPMSWAKAITIGCVMFVYLVVGVFCVANLAMTWGDPKGGASGNLPPVLTTAERIGSSVPAFVTLAAMFATIILWWKTQRSA